MTNAAKGEAHNSGGKLPALPPSIPTMPVAENTKIVEIYRRKIVVVNPLGLHWRVAERFSRAAKSFASAVRVVNGETTADGKSPTDLILLVALPGTELTLEVQGIDARDALEKLAEILAAVGGEDYAI
jgi:phosphotransferase system HPr (HPr) family protein